MDLGSVLESELAWTEVEIQCVKGICRLKLVSSSGFSLMLQLVDLCPTHGLYEIVLLLF